eukprot:12106698-Ditylum_brightwellii.AAC.1
MSGRNRQSVGNKGSTTNTGSIAENQETFILRLQFRLRKLLRLTSSYLPQLVKSNEEYRKMKLETPQALEIREVPLEKD